MRFSTYLTVLIFLFTHHSLTGQNHSEITYLEWIDDPTSTMVVNWISSSDGNELLEYRERGSDGNWIQLVPVGYEIPTSNLIRYRVHLTSLEAGSSYEYRIEGFSDFGFFRTAPSSVEEPIRFVIGSDFTDPRGTEEEAQARFKVFEEVNELAAAYNPHFLIAGGDFVHTDDDFPDVLDWLNMLETWSEQLITKEGDYKIPIIGIIGNHEVPNRYNDTPEDAMFYHTFFSYPTEQWGVKRGYGVLDFSDYLSIITLDTDHTHSITEQNNWLRNTLRDRRNVAHVYPAYHFPGWPAFNTLRGTREDMVRNEWHPYFKDNNIRFVFEHHDHIYKRTNPFECTIPITNIRSCSVEEFNGVVYAGGGSWASDIRPINSSFINGSETWVHRVIEEQNNFIVMEITDKKRLLRAVSHQHGVIDEVLEYFRLDTPENLTFEDVGTNSFLAVWEESEGADRYRIDVSYDPDFNNFVDGYFNRRVNQNQRLIDELDPDFDYYVRVRSENDFTRSPRTSAVKVFLAPEPPEQIGVMDVNVTRFTAHWLESDRATGYIFDLARDIEFSQPIDEYYGVELNGQTSIFVDGLNPGTQYYYRVRPVRFGTEGENTEPESIQTLEIIESLSRAELSANRILANGQQTADISVRLIGNNGEPLNNVPVILAVDSENVILNSNDNETNQFGEINFHIANVVAEKITFKFFVTDTQIFDPGEIEFMPLSANVELNHNFPNPFNYSTNIPVLLPERSRIQLTIFDSLGRKIMTLVDEEREAGYYEFEFIPRGLSSGTYYYRLVTKDKVDSKNMMYIR